MAEDQMAAARVKGLQNKADERGIAYNAETTEDALRTAIKEFDLAKKEAEKAPAAPVGLSASDMGAILKEVKNTLRPDHIEDGIVSEADLDPEDETTEKIYFHPASWGTVPMKRVGGQQVKAPFRKLVFKLEYGSRVQNGTQWNTRYLSAIRTKSKREQAYIETHPLFGRAFFTSHGEAEEMTEKAKRSVLFGRHYAGLQVKHYPEIYKMAADLHVKTGLNEALNDLRIKVADALTDGDVKRAENQVKQLLSTKGRESLLGGAQA